MRALNKIASGRIAISAGLAAGALIFGANAAVADPPSGVTPRISDVISVGSDTIQNVENAIAADRDATSSSKFYSFDAVPQPSNITPKAGCSPLARPNGSGAGIAALKSSQNIGTRYCVDIARSSRGPAAGDGSNGALAFVAFARDAVTWSANSATNLPADLSTTQLKAIYSCDASILGTGKTGPVTQNEIGGVGTQRVAPIIPQSASGTRSFFLSKIGVTTLGTCVKPTDNSVEENEGTNAIFATNAKNQIFPYSVAVYLAQTEHNHGAGTEGNLVLHSVDGTAPTTTVKEELQINPTFPYTRQVYNVVRDSGTSTHVPTNLQSLLGKANDTGYFCTNAKAQGEIDSFGFLSLGTSCGNVTVAPAGS